MLLTTLKQHKEMQNERAGLYFRQLGKPLRPEYDGRVSQETTWAKSIPDAEKQPAQRSRGRNLAYLRPSETRMTRTEQESIEWEGLRSVRRAEANSCQVERPWSGIRIVSCMRWEAGLPCFRGMLWKSPRLEKTDAGTKVGVVEWSEAAGFSIIFKSSAGRSANRLYMGNAEWQE